MAFGLEDQRIKIDSIGGGTGGRFIIKISYTSLFDAGEIGQEFEDSVRLREEDDTSGDDVITNWAHPAVFTPTQGSERAEWTYPILAGSELDTELGGEEIYGEIFLRKRATGQTIVRSTAVFPLAV
jgi:hypothetical protein